MLFLLFLCFSKKGNTRFIAAITPLLKTLLLLIQGVMKIKGGEAGVDDISFYGSGGWGFESSPVYHSNRL